MPPERRKRKTGCPTVVTSHESGNSYAIGETLGKGGFGIVKLATNVRTHDQFAAKIMDMETVRREGLIQYIERETRMVQQLSHPHIIKLLEVLDVEEYDLRFYIMELASNGELFDQIVAVNRFSEKTARRYYQQFMSGVRYCHSRGVVHRDLKAENLLVDKNNRLKICDFGLSRNCVEEALPANDRQIMFTSIAGSLDYQAPEILRDSAYHGKPADIWACGVILAFMLSGWLPFQDATSDELTRRRILSVPPTYKLHNDISRDAKDLIERCLKVEPQQRITADEIIKHPWFQVGLDAKRCHQLKIPERLLGLTPDNTEVPATARSPATGTVGGVSGMPGVDRGMLGRLRVAFDTIDVDKSGFIKPEELRDVLIKLASAHGEAWVPSRDEVQDLIKFFDTAGDGRISFQEFVVGFVEKKVEQSHTLGERISLRDIIDNLSVHGILAYDARDEGMKEYVNAFREAFDAIDEDKTGVIRPQELQNLFTRAGIETTPQEIDALFQQMDTGKQHFITFEEFVSAWMRSQSQSQSPKSGKASPGPPGLSLLKRLTACKELITVAELDEARKTLSHASTLGIALKGDVPEAAETLREVLESKEQGSPFRGVQLVKEQGGSSTSLRIISSQTECSADITPLLLGYSRINIRRLTGKTAHFHRFYKAYQAAISATQAYKQAEEDLAEEGPLLYV